MTIPTTAAEHVAAGAAVLDEVRPGWREEIDTKSLDIDGVYECVLGQLWGRFGPGREALVALGHDAYGDGWTYRHGFDPAGDDSAALTRAWVAEVVR